MPTTKRVIPGTVIEILTPQGLAYAQYTRRHPQMGDLLRILPGLHSARPTDLSRLVNQRELFWVFIPLEPAIQLGQAVVLSPLPVPEWASNFPVMKSGARDEHGKIHNWWLWDGDREWRVDQLEPGQENLSLAQIWTMPVLAQRLAEGWTPAEEYKRTKPTASPETSRPNVTKPTDAAGNESNDDPKRSTDQEVISVLQFAGADLSQSREINHYLYFSKEGDARRAAKILKKKGFQTEVDIGGDDVSYRVKVAHFDVASPERIAAVRDELSDLASSLGGDYDGWEAAVSGLTNQ